MKAQRPIIVLAIVALLSACSSKSDFVCRQEPYDIVLTPAKRTDKASGMTLVSISRSRKVAIRWGDLLQTARPGESFVAADGRSYGFLTLRSVDPDSGRVVVEGTVFALYDQ
jgi:hypothetical protein